LACAGKLGYVDAPFSDATPAFEVCASIINIIIVINLI
jgi:hypothetical protein